MRIPLRAPAAALVLLLAGGRSASAAFRKPTRPEDLAARAALAATHGGRVAKVARENEGGATWEVEVWLPQRRRVDVLLDPRYRVLDVSNEQDPAETPAGRRARSPCARGSRRASAPRCARACAAA